MAITKDKGINKDGYPTGGVDIGDSTGKVTTVEVQGRRRMLKDKKKTATWF
jgi:hypothetical protein